MFQLSGGISEYRFLKGIGTSSDNQLSKIICADPTDSNNAATKKYVDNSAINNIYESNINWGGRNLSATFSPIDACLIEDLGANRLAGIPTSKLKFERSSNGGSTWTSYSSGSPNICTTDGNASNANTTSSQSVNNWHRITIDVSDKIYCELSKIAIYLSTDGATGCKCKVEYGDYSSSTAWRTATESAVGGWSGWNILNVYEVIGSASYGKVKYVRLTFSQTGVNSSYNSSLIVMKVRFYSRTCWNQPSTLAATGHLYSYDGDLNANFPNAVNAKVLKYNGQDTDSRYAKKSDIPSAEISIGSTTPVR